MKFKDLDIGVKFRFVGGTIHCIKVDRKGYCVSGEDTIFNYGGDREVEVPKGVEFTVLKRGQQFYWVFSYRCNVKLNEDMYRTPEGHEKYVHSTKRLTLAFES